ncbi:MAG: hypothetical protein ACLFNX_12025 [Spirochaetaceae bacterium]
MRRILVALLGAMMLWVGGLEAQELEEAVRMLVTEFSEEFRRENPDLVLQPNIAILPVSNESPDATRHFLGEAVTRLVEQEFDRSLVFSVVDRTRREEAIEELTFALSGFVEEESIEPGRMEGVEYFADGAVTAVADDFIITLRAIAVESSEVIFVGEERVTKDAVIESAERIGRGYVSAYGIGFETSVVPLYYMNNAMSDIEGQPTGVAKLMVFTLTYRPTRRLAVWTGFETPLGAFRMSKTDINANRSYDSADVENFDDTSLASNESSVSYQKERDFFGIILGAGYVWHLSRDFNVTLGGSLHAYPADVRIHQEYFGVVDGTNSDGKSANMVTEYTGSFFLYSVRVKGEYFFNPRLTAHAGYEFLMQQTNYEDSVTFYQDVQYENDARIDELYELDPSRDPDGRAHVNELSGHRLFFGLGLYF